MTQLCLTSATRATVDHRWQQGMVGDGGVLMSMLVVDHFESFAEIVFHVI